MSEIYYQFGRPMRVIIHHALIGRVLEILERKVKHQCVDRAKRDGVSSVGCIPAAAFTQIFFFIIRI